MVEGEPKRKRTLRPGERAGFVINTCRNNNGYKHSVMQTSNCQNLLDIVGDAVIEAQKKVNEAFLENVQGVSSVSSVIDAHA